jgi:hypothetical protein
MRLEYVEETQVHSSRGKLSEGDREISDPNCLGRFIGCVRETAFTVATVVGLQVRTGRHRSGQCLDPLCAAASVRDEPLCIGAK